MKKVLFLVVALILYGSFYPWHFQSQALPVNPLWILLHSWSGPFDRYGYRDAVVNFTLYIPFGVVCFLALSPVRPGAWAALLTLLAGVTLSASIEMAQLFAPQRVCSLQDLLCNSLGTLAGAGLGALGGTPITRVVRRSESAGVWRFSAGVALLYLWIGWLLFPFFPALFRSVVRAKILALMQPANWTPLEFLNSFAGWLAVAALLEDLVGRAHLKIALLCAMLLLPVKILIVDRTLGGAEIAGAVAGIAAWILVRDTAQPRMVAGGLVLAALVAAGLAPFRFSATAQPFEWIPFLPMLESPWQSAFLILLEKSFLYGSAVWLLLSNRFGWKTSLAAVASALALVEAAQSYLPGRTPEITDPILAILLGFGLVQLQRRNFSAKATR